MKKLSKIQEADALLWAAKHWQNGNSRPGSVSTARSEFTSEFWQDADEGSPYGTIATMSASAALSEVAGMGLDFE